MVDKYMFPEVPDGIRKMPGGRMYIYPEYQVPGYIFLKGRNNNSWGLKELLFRWVISALVPACSGNFWAVNRA